MCKKGTIEALFYLTESKRSQRRCFIKKLFLKILQNSQEKTCARVSFWYSCRLNPATLLKKRLQHRCFCVNFIKYLITHFLQNTSGRLLLKMLFRTSFLCLDFYVTNVVLCYYKLLQSVMITIIKVSSNKDNKNLEDLDQSCLISFKSLWQLMKQNVYLITRDL